MAKPIDRRSFERQLRKLCRQNQIGYEAVGSKGSHRGIVLTDPKTTHSITLVITNDKEISSGVQREILKYVAGIGVRFTLAEAIKEILSKIFEN